METQWFIFIESLISQRSVEQEDSLVHTAIEVVQFYIFQNMGYSIHDQKM